MFKALSPPTEAGIQTYFNSSTGFYYYGYCIDLILQIKENMGFQFTLSEPPDGMYGSMQADGTWNGMIDELKKDVSCRYSLCYCLSCLLKH